MSSLRGVLRRSVAWWPPLVAWLLATAFVLLVCRHEGWPPFSASASWSRWDSVRYLSIANQGYNLFPCRPPTYAAGTWCGNAGWFPAYPWIAGGLHWLSLPTGGSALVVSWIACLAALVLLWRAFLVGLPRPAGALALAYAACAPGLVYDYAIFPLSLLSLCTIAALALLLRGRSLAAGLAAGLAAIAYPVGLALAPAGVAWLIADRRLPAGVRLRRVALYAAPILVALAVFVVDQRLETGRWNAYLLVQRKYGHGLQDPFSAVYAAAQSVFHGSAFHLVDAPALQTLFVALVLVLVLLDRLLHRASASAFDALVVIWALAAWLVPHIWANVSEYRSEAALLPIAILVGRLPRALSACIVAGAFLLVAPMELLFLRSVLV